MNFFNCISLEQASEVITKALAQYRPSSEIVPLEQSVGRVAAEQLIAVDDIPAFSRSTVDGFAVVSSDTFGAGEGSPVLLDIAGEIVMGHEAGLISSGQVKAIPTGGMLPRGADAVVMLEHTEYPDDQTLLVLRPVAPGDNIILRGEDMKEGAVTVEPGEGVTPEKIGILAACGIDKVTIFRKATVSIISTGDEIVDIHQTPELGQVRDINSYALAAAITELGCDVVRHGIVRDDYQELLEVLEQAVRTSDMVILSGGSSVGARDYTLKAIAALGTPGVLFHGVAVKPGKPTIFGLVKEVPVFGLPGHPAAAMSICDQLVKPAADLLNGRVDRKSIRIPVRLIRNIASAPGRVDLVKVRLISKEGQYWAEPIFGKSGLISTLAKADGVIRIPADKGGLNEGEWAEVTVF